MPQSLVAKIESGTRQPTLPISRVRVFGSVARGEDRPDSDIDLLVDLAPHADPLRHLTFDEAARTLLGCPVDVMTTPSISPLLRDTVLAEARDLDRV